MEALTDPINWWYEPFAANVFMQNALWAGMLAVIATSVVGLWVVLRGMSFLGDALAHGVLPGLAIAFTVGGNLTVGALLAALAMMGGIRVIRSVSPLPEDTSIGILFVGFLATAVVILSAQSGSYVGDLNRFLFGSITGVTTNDLWRQGIVAAISVLGVIVCYRAFLVMTFDEITAQMLGLRPRMAHIVLLVLLALSIVASFQAVGNLLVFAFLIAPPATATLLLRRVPVMMVAAVVLGFSAVVIGLLISYHHGTAAGATMALVAVIEFGVGLVVRAALRSAGVITGPRIAS